MVLFRDNETNNLNETTWLKIQTGMRWTSGLYLQAWLRIWTWDYREQIQLAARAGLELGVSELQI